MTGDYTIVVALTFASMGGVFVGFGYMLRYRERADLMDTPSWRKVTDERALARYVGTLTALLGLLFVGMATGIVGEYVDLVDTWMLFITMTVTYAAAVYYGNLTHSVPVTTID
jgi:hypothetical protein